MIKNQIHNALLAVFACALLLGVGSGTALAQSSLKLKFPYQGIVLHDAATIHSGPGQVHYATEQLKQGAVVEIYREDPGGWCAIRPVNGSFSLVPEATLEIIEEGIGRIVEDGTQAWVGTKLGPVDQPLWQVKLKKGEMVEVLGQVSWPSPEGHSTIWYQISPPAGEFRWVRMSDIQLPASSAQITSVFPQRDPAFTQINPSASVRSLNDTVPVSPPIDLNTMANQPPNLIANHSIGNGQSNQVQQATLQTDQTAALPRVRTNSVEINRGWRQTTRPIGNGDTGQPFDRGIGKGTMSDGTASHRKIDDFRQDEFPANETMRVASADVLAPSLARELNSARTQNGFTNNERSQDAFSQNGQPPLTLSQSISDLELQLTREMIKQDPAEWRLEDLELAANTIYRSSSNQTERVLAEKYLNKILNCKTIRAGYRSDSGGTFTSSSSNPTRPFGTGVDLDVELGTTYDAHGWLTELVRDGGRSQSNYALQDDSGKITHHISPAPGMNLHRYLKSRVGVIGQRGYHSQLKLDHVTAHRIVELEKTPATFPR